MTPMHAFPPLTIALPPWVERYVASCDSGLFATIEGRMHFVLGLVRQNIENGTGGPFGAAIFDAHSHALIAPGVNLVLSSNCSVLHAEIVALMIAQRIRGTWDLGQSGRSPVELVSSTEPCAMCLGALPWAGIARLVCGARDEDARAVGFDEGSKVADWIGALQRRGIETTIDVCRTEAADLLTLYQVKGGTLYNGCQ